MGGFCSTVTVRENRQVPWSNLPSDVLCLIAGNLNTIDRGYFASVCRSWRSAVKGSSYAKDLWILYPTKHFLSCRNGKKYKSLGPITRLWSGWKPLGFSEGWLVMQRSETVSCGFKPPLRHTCLLNPFDGNHISLPRTQTRLTRCVVNPLTSRDHPLIVYGIFVHYVQSLAFTRRERGGEVGFKNWILVRGVHGGLSHLTFIEGLVYAFDETRIGFLSVYRINHDTAVATRVKLFRYPQHFIESSGGVVKVKECIMLVEVSCWHKSFRLWKLEERDGNQYAWISVDNLGGKGCGLCLFVEYDHNFHIHTIDDRDHGIFKENHIYCASSGLSFFRGIISVNLEDGVFEAFTSFSFMPDCLGNDRATYFTRWIYG